MRAYLLKAAVLALVLLALHIATVVFVRAPIAAEYWVREAMVIKRHIASTLASPKIIFLGGSSTLFAIDARLVERELGVPALNYGLHACLHPSVLIEEAARVARSGDLIVLAMEPQNYSSTTAVWTDCQLKNAIAWGGEYIDQLCFGDRFKYVFTSGWPALSLEIITAKVGSLLIPSLYTERLAALGPSDQILARFESGRARTATFSYSAYNLSDRGDVAEAVGENYRGPGASGTSPAAIFPRTKVLLAAFVTEMKNRGVRVLVAHPPYLVDGAPAPQWRQAERAFAADVKDIGADLLDARDELFLPRQYFFNSELHLNAEGRRLRTERLIIDLQRFGMGHSSTAPPISGHLPASLIPTTTGGTHN